MKKLGKREKVEVEDFLREMVEAVNRRLNSIERVLDQKIKKQNETITNLERKISGISRKLPSINKLKVDKTLLNELGLSSEIVKPSTKTSTKEPAKVKKKTSEISIDKNNIGELEKNL